MCGCTELASVAMRLCAVQGVPGIKGVPGLPGSDGKDGNDGIPGRTGKPGDQGMSVSLAHYLVVGTIRSCNLLFPPSRVPKVFPDSLDQQDQPALKEKQALKDSR